MISYVFEIHASAIVFEPNIGKQTKNTFKPKNLVSTTRPLELLRMNLFGPNRTTSLGGKRYRLVIIDDYSRFTWVIFLAHNDETFGLFQKFLKDRKGTTGGRGDRADSANPNVWYLYKVSYPGWAEEPNSGTGLV